MSTTGINSKEESGVKSAQSTDIVDDISTTTAEDQLSTASISSKKNLTQEMSNTESNLNELFQTIHPFVHKLDAQVVSVSRTQQILLDELNRLLVILNQIKLQQSTERQQTATTPDSKQFSSKSSGAIFVYPKSMSPADEDISVDIEEKSRRLLGLKRRLTLVHSIMQTVNTRVKKLLLAHDSRLLQQNKIIMPDSSKRLT